jgi:hypothetical protein
MVGCKAQGRDSTSLSQPSVTEAREVCRSPPGFKVAIRNDNFRAADVVE